MAVEFYAGQIFKNTYPSEATSWCYENGAKIVEIEPEVTIVEESYMDASVMSRVRMRTRAVEKTIRRFQIVLLQQEKTTKPRKRRTKKQGV